MTTFCWFSCCCFFSVNLTALLATTSSLKRFDQNNSVKGKISCIESFLFVAPRALSSARVFGALCNGYDCVPWRVYGQNVKSLWGELCRINWLCVFPSPPHMGCYYRWSSTGYHPCPPLKNLVVLICLFLFFYFQSRRGEQQEVLYIDESRVMLKYLLPLNEVIVDFYDDLKSKSSGYARFVLDCEELLLWLLLVRTRQCEKKTAG